MKKIITSKEVTLAIIAATIILFSNGCCTTITTASSNDFQIREPSFSALTPHSPISIGSDDDFITYGFPGSGNSTHPYIIENYNITTTNERGIYITGTHKYFLIRNCYVDAGIVGIYSEYVANGTTTIINNT
ncbi:unnamed protein product, partial [marine sediment metagenome]